MLGEVEVVDVVEVVLSVDVDVDVDVDVVVDVVVVVDFDVVVDVEVATVVVAIVVLGHEELDQTQPVLLLHAPEIDKYVNFYDDDMLVQT